MVTKYYKILNDIEHHHGFQYKTGLNIDTIPFNPTGHCKPGGIYFARENILEFLSYGKYIREVVIPVGARIYTEALSGIVKYKADKLILRRKRIINSAFIIRLLDEGALPPYNIRARGEIIDIGIRDKSVYLLKHPKLTEVIKSSDLYWGKIINTKDVVFIKQMLRTFKPDKSNFDCIYILDYPKTIRRLIVEEVK